MASNPLLTPSLLDSDPLWYKDAIIYELHVRAFYDSNGDGIGDFRGLSEKLDYLQDLGVTAIWLLPFYPSPLKDDGYDISDNTGVHPEYGSLRDFRQFVREAHRRGLRVITELVCNHTSDQHPWFQRARRARPGSPWRDFYVWSDTPDKYREARIIFQDFEPSNWSWDPVAGAYYWHRFYHHQPDLNFDNPRVRLAMFKTVDFWFAMGVDGLRLDAVPYLYEREGTNCENLLDTHNFLRDLRRHVDSRYEHRMLLGEANQWPEDAAAYFGGGEECHMAFHFPVMPRMFMAIHVEDRFPIVDILTQTPEIPESAQWALFLRNHDELTLEMVTDEERDYMYRMYAHDPRMRINLGIRRRLAPLLGNNRRRIELMNGLLFALPGTPVIYYGDEIGMGDNIYLGDRNSVRTPMQWNADRNAGFSPASRQQLYMPVIMDAEYHHEAVNVQALQNNPNSLLWWMKRLIALRKRHKAFGRGKLEFLHPENPKVLAFLRHHEDEHILVVANLSRFVQCTGLDLRSFKGRAPVEIFGRIEFPAIGEQPYFLTLGPHSFYWFSLEPLRVDGGRVSRSDLQAPARTVTVAGPWRAVFQGRNSDAVARVLPDWLHGQRWFGGKGRTIRSVRIVDAVPVPVEDDVLGVSIVLAQVEYTEGTSEMYAVPVALVEGERAAQVLEERPQAIIARLEMGDGGGRAILYEAVADRAVCEALFQAVAGRRRWRGGVGTVEASPLSWFRRSMDDGKVDLEPSLMNVEQSNTSVQYGERFVLKLFRGLETGVSPELEIGRFLTDRGFASTPHMAGTIEYQPVRGEPMTLGILQGFVPNEGDAWRFTIDELGRYFERTAASQVVAPAVRSSVAAMLELAGREAPPLADHMIGGYRDAARLIGQRTAELHLALASAGNDAAFRPEAFSALYQRAMYQSMRSLATQSMLSLRRRLPGLPTLTQVEGEKVLDLEDEILGRFQAITQRRLNSMRIRCHGDFHLGQVLYTGRDFVIIDFEGEPARPLGERRVKRSPLRDVASMLRSFHYATRAALAHAERGGLVRSEDRERLEPWARFWQVWVSAAFLGAYRETTFGSEFLSVADDELQLLLEASLLEKAVYELGYELNNRPDWVDVPIHGILQVMSTEY